MGSHIGIGSDWNVTTLATPEWLDSGNNAWQLTAASLVGLQSIPGLMILYAGLVKKKWVVNSMLMVFVGFAGTLVCWCIWGYKVAFGEYMLPFAGRPGPILTMGEVIRQSYLSSAELAQGFPRATMAYFQFVFAGITIVLCAGAYLGRMNFKAWVLFVPLWLTFSYCVVAYSIWGGGFLFQMGVIDYSGGYVIHLASGTAAFTGAFWIGPRLKYDRENFQANNIPLMMLGAGILWTGWNGFNGGDPYAASPDAGVAVLHTNLTTATSLLTWTLCDVLYYKKPSIIGAVNGMITGLVAITPAAGVIPGWAAIVFGVVSGSIPWVSMNIAGKKWRLFTHYVDDTLGIVHTHMVAGVCGGFMVGLFATEEGCAAFGLTNPGGAIAGNGKQVWLQIVGALFVIGWNLFWTSAVMCFIKYVCRIPLRMTEEELIIGDDAIHGEEAYCFYDNMDGLEPSASVQKHALEQQRMIEATSRGKRHQVLEGQAIETPENRSRTPPTKEEEEGREVKME